MNVNARAIARWANSLNNNSEWVAAINAAFDSIGFTKDYIRQCGKKVRGTSFHRVKAVKDNVWGMIELEPSAVWLLDSPILQRLRSIKQLGFSYLTYPNAQHSRFEHTLGVHYVANRLLNSFRRTEELDNESIGDSSRAVKAVSYVRKSKEEVLLQHASILHDIGHLAFSHVSEEYFSSRTEGSKIGPFELRKFVDDFCLEYDTAIIGSETRDTHSKLRLSELLSVTIIVSRRFQEFYELFAPKFGQPTQNTLCEVATLILGDFIEPKDRALPQVLSGPVDADKIDYMMRDAQACGISISVDESRAFLRAGVYEISDQRYLPERQVKDGWLAHGTVRIFVIDQSGTDAVREMGAARLSLYNRVYFHQLTRNAETHFHNILDQAQVSKARGLAFSKNILKFWSLDDNSVISTLSKSNDNRVAELANALQHRDVLKRSASFGTRHFLSALPDWMAQAREFADPINIARQEILQNLKDRILDRRENRKLLEALSDECAKIRRLIRLRYNVDQLPAQTRPPEIRLVPFPAEQTSQPPQAFVLTADRHVQLSEFRLPAYFDAGGIPELRGYLRITPEWRSIALIAFQALLYREFLNSSPETISLPVHEETENANSTLEGKRKVLRELTVRTLYRPILDLDLSAHECKIAIEEIKEIQENLSRAGYYDEMPSLLPFPASNIPVSLRERITKFEGDGGWNMDVNGYVASKFISQFPPKLRKDAIRLVELIKSNFLDRETLTSAIVQSLKNLHGFDTEQFHLVPLTPSSGYLIRQLIKPHISDLNRSTRGKLILHSSLSDALFKVKPGSKIIFYDDNIASGTQAENQFLAWFGKKSLVTGTNAFKKPLSPKERHLLCRMRLGFVFAIGRAKGIERLIAACTSLGLNVQARDVTFNRSLDRASGVGRVSPALRNFLKIVGRGLIFDLKTRKHSFKRDEVLREAEGKALGYDNLQGLTVLCFNVPTSTYTALWCPGTYSPSDSDGAGLQRIPWCPLFLRAGHLGQLVLS